MIKNKKNDKIALIVTLTIIGFLVIIGIIALQSPSTSSSETIYTKQLSKENINVINNKSLDNKYLEKLDNGYIEVKIPKKISDKLYLDNNHVIINYSFDGYNDELIVNINNIDAKYYFNIKQITSFVIKGNNNDIRIKNCNNIESITIMGDYDIVNLDEDSCIERLFWKDTLYISGDHSDVVGGDDWD